MVRFYACTMNLFGGTLRHSDRSSARHSRGSQLRKESFSNQFPQHSGGAFEVVHYWLQHPFYVISVHWRTKLRRLKIIFMLRESGVALFAVTVLSLAADLPSGFDPARWPGRKESSAEYKALVNQLRTAEERHDIAAVTKAVEGIRRDLGDYAGVPEVKPEYGSPVERSVPDLKAVEAIIRRSFDSMKGSDAWERAAHAKPYGQPRLRETFRTTVSDLRAFEAGIPNAADYRADAIIGLNYLITQQTSSGVFGYPYDPEAKEGLKSQAAALVVEGTKHGIKMTEGAWMIDDLDEGGLQFDNGEAGAALLYAYALTHDNKYLNSARRAADWAIGRRLVPNWNYNSYSGWLLARMYRVTGERKYLDAAIDKFEVGVLPGQMENGRWVDQHNARPQYHALMIRNLVEYSLALEQAKDSRAAEVRSKTKLALGSLAEEAIRYGSSNAEEGLPLEALCVSLIALGENARWEEAANIHVNYTVNHLLPTLIEARRGRPETLTSYLLWRRTAEHKARACEISIARCLK